MPEGTISGEASALGAKPNSKSSRAFAAGVAAIVLVGGAVHGAALKGPLALDDYAQRAMIEGSLTVHRGPFNLYDFVADSNRTDLLAWGAFPWWTDAQLKVRFFRPLASVLVWVDHRLFGYDPFVPHVFSLGWWMAAVIAMSLLYRRCLPPLAAILATAIFALSPCHSTPLVWLANRSVLVTLVFGSLGLRSYLGWRDRPCGLLFLAAFLSGEYAAALLGYVLAIETTGPQRSIRRRVLGLLPFLIPGAAVSTLSALLGYGTRSSGYYVHPLTEFSAYAARVPANLISLLGLTWFGFADNWATSVSLPLWGMLLSVTVILSFLWIRNRCPATHRSDALWLLAGSLLAALPLLGAQSAWRIAGP